VKYVVHILSALVEMVKKEKLSLRVHAKNAERADTTRNIQYQILKEMNGKDKRYKEQSKKILNIEMNITRKLNKKKQYKHKHLSRI